MFGKKSDTVITPYPPDRLGVDKMHPGSPGSHKREKKKNRKRPRENVSVCSRLNWNLNKKMFFEERERPEYLGKNLSK